MTGLERGTDGFEHGRDPRRICAQLLSDAAIERAARAMAAWHGDAEGEGAIMDVYGGAARAVLAAVVDVVREAAE